MGAQHWNHVYATKDPTQVSWFEPVPARSLALIERVASPGSAIVDVGAGASLLADHLLARGFSDLTLLDISDVALALVRGRLGQGVVTHATDVLAWQPERRFDVWHDRAVFHFLTDPADRAAYREVLLAGLREGGHAIVQAFHLTGPSRCSDLPTAQHDLESLFDALGGPEHFEQVESWVHQHPHPRGGTQAFQGVLVRRRG